MLRVNEQLESVGKRMNLDLIDKTYEQKKVENDERKSHFNTKLEILKNLYYAYLMKKKKILENFLKEDFVYLIYQN